MDNPGFPWKNAKWCNMVFIPMNYCRSYNLSLPMYVLPWDYQIQWKIHYAKKGDAKNFILESGKWKPTHPPQKEGKKKAVGKAVASTQNA